MGIKGLSKGVIKQVWTEQKLDDLPPGTRVGIDAPGLIHRAVVSNADHICLEVANSAKHQAHFVRSLQTLLHAKSNLIAVVVLDGAPWPLKKNTHAERCNKRDVALEKAKEALKLNDK